MLPRPLALRSSFIVRLTLIAAAALTALTASPGLAQTPDALPGSGWVVINEASPWSEPPDAEIVTSVLDSISVTVDLHGFEVETVHHGSDEFQKLSFLDESFTSETGKPELPVVRMMLAIPDCDSYSLRVELGDSTEFSGATVWPVPGWAVGHEDDYEYTYEVFAMDEDFYQDDVLHPASTAVIADDGWVRNQRYVILELRPVRYNPESSLLRCYSSLSVSIRFDDPVQTNVSGLGPFESACRAVMTNYDGQGAWFERGGRGSPCDTNFAWCSTVGECETQGTDYLMIVEDSIIDSAEVEALAAEKSWYDCFNVGIVKTSDIASPIGPDAIKSFIKSLYETESAANMPDDRLGFVLLVGDARELTPPGSGQSTELLPAYEDSFIPSGGDTTTSHWVTTDHWYACVHGDDHAPDLALGRLAVGDTTELATEAQKIIDFEPVPLSEAWTDSILLSCGFADSGWGDPGDSESNQEGAHVQIDRIEGIVPSGYSTRQLHIHDEDCTPLPDCQWVYGRIQNDAAVEAGKLIVVQWAHGNPCGSSPFRSKEVDGLQNDDKLPLWINMSCSTGDFANTISSYGCGDSGDNPDCLGEFLMHWDTTGETGTIGFFGATEPSFDKALAGRILDGFFGEYQPMLGQAVFYAKLDHLSDNPGSPRPINNFNLLGDPALNLFLGEAGGYGSKPDLVVRDTDIVVPSFPSIPEVALQCQVHNESGCSTDPDTVVVAFDIYRKAGGLSASLRDTVAVLDRWESAGVSATWTVPGDSVGAYRLIVRADPDGAITELIETNNATADSVPFYLSFYAEGFPVDLPYATTRVSPITVADTDGNGHGEIFFTTSAGRVCKFSHEGEEIWTYPSGNSGGIPQCPAIADLDSDGKPEVVAAIPGQPLDGEDRIYVLNAEDGATRLWKSVAVGEIYSGPVVADLDPVDGRPEVAIIDTVGQGAGRISVWDFAPPTPTLRWGKLFRSNLYDVRDPSAPPTAINFGLRPSDLVHWGECWDDPGILCVAADCSTRWRLDVDCGSSNPGLGTSAGDLDNDGEVELASVGRMTSMLIIHSSVTDSVIMSAELPCNIAEAVLGDLDGDDHLEVVVAGRGSVLVYDDELELLWSREVPGDPAGETLIADVDGGSHPEILVGRTSGHLYILKVPDSGTDLALLVDPIELPAGYSTGAVCDLDGNGQNDIVFATNDGLLHRLEYWGASEPLFEWPMYRHDARNTGLYEQPVSGSLLESTTWSGDVLVRGDVTVSEDDTLWIAPGTNVMMSRIADAEASGRDTARCELIVEGRLHAVGGEVDAIRFHSAAASPDTGDWYGVSLESASVCTLGWAYVSDATKSLWAISPDPLTVRDCSFTNQSVIGVHLQSCGSSTSVDSCTISRCVTGVRMDSCSAFIHGNTVEDASVYGILMQYDLGSSVEGNDLSTDAGEFPSLMPVGIRVTHADSALLVQDNTVRVPDDGGSGLSFYYVSNDSARIRGNDLTGPGAGDATVCRGMRFDSTNATVRWNRLHEFNRYFHISGYPSQPVMPDLGDTSASDGMNCTYDRPSGYYVYAEGSGGQDLYAQNNWWGTDNPSRSLFYGSGVTIHWSPYLTSDPHESRDGSDQEPGRFRYFLAQNCPNPFNPVTTVRYGLAEGGRVTLRIYDVTGRVVRTLVDQRQPAGRHAVLWDGRNDAGQRVGSGVYFCRVRSGPFDEKRKLVLLK